MEDKGISEKKFYNYAEDIFEEFTTGDVFVVDHKVLDLYKTLREYLEGKNFLVIDSNEKNKDLSTVNSIYDFMLKQEKVKRLVAIGGGIVGDIAGYAAGTFKRGVPYVNVPTTLIAMCDSSIGGKTGVNYKGVKNYIGTFKDADKIVFCFEFLNTLEKKEIKSGIGELIKYGLIGDKTILDFLLDKNLKKLTTNNLKHLIKKAIPIKEYFVKKDYFDTGIRNALNFGHSIGHGVEMLSEENISHGEAVCLGMLAELKLSEVKLNLDKELLSKVKTILSQYEINEKTKVKDIDELISLIYKDKKNDDFLRFTLLENIEKPVSKMKISKEELVSAIKEILE